MPPTKRQRVTTQVATRSHEEEMRARQDFFMYTYKTKMCKGEHEYSEFCENCINAHSTLELRRDPRLHSYRLSRCLYYDSEEGCRRGDDCPYVHCNNEVLFHPSKYKCVMCPRWAATSSCVKGELCVFAHSEDELRRPMDVMMPPPIPESQRAPHINGPRGRNLPPRHTDDTPRTARAPSAAPDPAPSGAPAAAASYGGVGWSGGGLDEPGAMPLSTLSWDPGGVGGGGMCGDVPSGFFMKEPPPPPPVWRGTRSERRQRCADFIEEGLRWREEQQVRVASPWQ